MSQVPVTLHFGKETLTDAWLEELREQLLRRKVVKVRFTTGGRSAKTPKEWAAEIAPRVEATIEDVRGFTVTFRR
jgi:RNA-binding protein YhbY